MTLDISTSEFVAVAGRGATVASPKYTTTLRDVPQTVALIPRAMIEEQGATTLSAALRNVPGITLQAGEGGGASNTAGVWGGREEPGIRAAAPCWGNAWMALRTVCGVHRKVHAMAVVCCPSALARRIWQRRTVKAWDERRPAVTVWHSAAVSGRRKIGVCIPNSIPHDRQPCLRLH